MPCKRSRIVRDPHVRKHSAEFLREPRLVELQDVLAFEVRGQAEQTARSDDARAADAGDQDVVHGPPLAASGSARLGSASARAGAADCAVAPVNVTKLGQNPSKQLKSWLHED